VDDAQRVETGRHALAQAHGPLDPAGEEVGVDRVAAAREHARADQALTIPGRDPEERAARIAHLDQVAVRGCAFDGLDLVAEHPGMTAAHPPVLVPLQEQPRHRRAAGRARRRGAVRHGRPTRSASPIIR